MKNFWRVDAKQERIVQKRNEGCPERETIRGRLQQIPMEGPPASENNDGFMKNPKQNDKRLTERPRYYGWHKNHTKVCVSDPKGKE